MKGATAKKATLKVLSLAGISYVTQKFLTVADPPFAFFAHISKIFDKCHIQIFFIEYLGSLTPVRT